MPCNCRIEQPVVLGHQNFQTVGRNHLHQRIKLLQSFSQRQTYRFRSGERTRNDVDFRNFRRIGNCRDFRAVV